MTCKRTPGKGESVDDEDEERSSEDLGPLSDGDSSASETSLVSSEDAASVLISGGASALDEEESEDKSVDEDVDEDDEDEDEEKVVPVQEIATEGATLVLSIGEASLVFFS